MALAALMPSMMQAASIDVVATLAPENTTSGSGVRGVNALTVSQTWTANNEYFLTDKVFIPKGIVLVIEPGTKIFGITSDPLNTPTNRADDQVGSLVAARGGVLIADGTAAAPIVFSSVADWEAQNGVDSPFDADALVSPAPTKSTAGQWGGVVLLGNAYINHLNGTGGTVLGNATIEGFVPNADPSDDGDSPALPDSIEYGFDSTNPRDDFDSSGVLRYVSIRHGGYEFDAGREINGLTLGGVGAGTIINHIEVFANQDDGIEFFGGTVSTSHIVLAYNQDDNFDFDSGHTGKHQFFFSISEPGFADGGWEADGIEGSTASQLAYDNAFDPDIAAVGTATQAQKITGAGVTLSKPIVYNATLIGPGRTNTFSTIQLNFGQVLTEKGNHGLIYDDYFNGELYNSVIDDFSQDLLFLRDGSNKSTGATAAIAHNTIGRFGSAAIQQIETATAVGTITGAGDLDVTLTGTGIIGSPLTVTVPVLLGDTAAIWAGKVRAALAGSAGVTTNYTVRSSSSTTIVLTANTGGSNDGTLNINLQNGTATGITAAASSANTLAGAASSVTVPVVLADNATYITGSNTPALVYNALTGAVLDNNSSPNTDPQYTTYTRGVGNVLTAINPIPAPGSPLLSGSLQAGAPVTVNYRGAFGTTNWAAGWTKFSATGVLQGAAEGAPPFADADSDGISDALETANNALGLNPAVSDAGTVLPTLKTTAQFDANFTAGQTSVTSNPSAFSLYTASSIQDLRGTGMMIGPFTPGGPATLSLPLFSSTDLITWTPEGNATRTLTTPVGKNFYRVNISSNAPNP